MKQHINHLKNITEANFTFTNIALPFFDPLNEYQWTQQANSSRRSTSRGATQISYQSTEDSAQSAGETQQYQDTDHHWDQASCWEQPEDIYVKSEFDPAPSNTDATRQDWRTQKSISSDDTVGGWYPTRSETSPSKTTPTGNNCQRRNTGTDSYYLKITTAR